MLARMGLLCGRGQSAFADPRAGKTNLLIGSQALSSVARGAGILGADGITLDGVRYTSQAVLNAYLREQGGTANIGQVFTVGAYFRTPSNQAISMFWGNSSQLQFSGSKVSLGYYSDWTLVEVSLTKTNSNQTIYMYLGGTDDTFTINEWIEMSKPMMYLGNKVT